MSLLEFSEIVFNFTATLVVIVVGALVAVIGFEVIAGINRAKYFAGELKRESVELYQKLDKFLITVSSLSFVSKLFKKKAKKHENEE